MRRNNKRWFGILLSLVMVLGLMPGMSLTAYAATIACNPVNGGTIDVQDGVYYAKANSGYKFVYWELKMEGVASLLRNINNSLDGSMISFFEEVTACFVLPVNSVTLDPTASLTVGETKTLTATVSPDGATHKSVAWASSNESVATVDTNGVVTAVAAGTANITATATNGTDDNADDQTATCTVTVNKGAGSISYATTTLTKTFGDAAFINKLTKTGDGSVSYESNNSNAASVDASTGEVTIVGTGTATITATVTDGDNHTYATKITSYNLTINKAVPTNTVSQLSAFRGKTLGDVALPTADNGVWSWVEDSTTTLENVGMTTYHATFTPNDTVNYDILTDVEVIIQVTEKPSAVPATITANNRTYDGTDKPLVSVDNSTLAGGEMQYALGDANGATQSYTTSIPSKTEAGTYYVWYKVKGDNSHADSKAACVPVTIAVSVSITLDKNEAELAVGEALFLTATITPENVADKRVMWVARGDDGEIAFYSDKACTMPVKQGTATNLLTVYIKGVSPGSRSGLKIDVDSVSAPGEHASCLVKVTKANASAATVTSNNRTYNGTEEPLVKVDASTLAGGTMQYALGTAAEVAGTYSPSIPKAADAGTYYVWYYVKADKDHIDTKPQSIRVSIAEAEKDYSYVSGAGDTWQLESGESLSFRIKNPADDSKTYENFQSIDVDGKTVPETDYTKESGSVIIRLQPAYLETLSVGKHTLKANFTDGGSAETTFTIAPASVKAASLPQTGDNSRLLLWIVLVISSMVGVFVFARKRA